MGEGAEKGQQPGWPVRGPIGGDGLKREGRTRTGSAESRPRKARGQRQGRRSRLGTLPPAAPSRQHERRAPPGPPQPRCARRGSPHSGPAFLQAGTASAHANEGGRYPNHLAPVPAAGKPRTRENGQRPGSRAGCHTRAPPRRAGPAASRTAAPESATQHGTGAPG